MKRTFTKHPSNYVRASLMTFSKALEDLLINLESDLFEEFPEDEFTFEINSEHRCIDVFKDDMVYAQVYPTYQRDSKPYNAATFKYVGQGEGDYIKDTRKTARPLYDPDDFYIKYIDFTSES